MASNMDIRQELWMYVEVSTHAIKEWKTLLFKKVRYFKFTHLESNLKIMTLFDSKTLSLNKSNYLSNSFIYTGPSMEI